MNRLKKGLAALARPAYWPALMRGVVPSVEHGYALARRNFATVIDVGANKGQFATFAHYIWPKANLICFEPLPGPRAKLIAVTAGCAKIYPLALGEVEGEAEMHIASREDSSSLLPLGETQRRLFDMRETHCFSVPVRRLDTLIDSDTLGGPALLKIDVQGFEFEVLKGAEGLIDAIDAIYVEASFVELYGGQRLANDVAALLGEYGFGEAGRFNLCTSDGALVQADILFERA